MLRDETQGTETEEGCVETEEAMPVALYKYLLATDKASQRYPVCLCMCCDFVISQHMHKHTKRNMGKKTVFELVVIY